MVKLDALPRAERLSHLPSVSLEDSLRPHRQEGPDSGQRSSGRCPAASRTSAIGRHASLEKTDTLRGSMVASLRPRGDGAALPAVASLPSRLHFP